MPMHQGTAVRSRNISRTEYCVGTFLCEGYEQRGNVRRIVFKISVMNDADLARRVFDGLSYGRAFSKIFLVPQKNDSRIVGCKSLQNRPGSICTPVVDNDDFETTNQGVLQRENSFETCFNNVL